MNPSSSEIFVKILKHRIFYGEVLVILLPPTFGRPRFILRKFKRTKILNLRAQKNDNRYLNKEKCNEFIYPAYDMLHESSDF
jgi:hypothetical protein